MPFEQNGEIKIHVIPKPHHSYDFTVIKDASDVVFRGTPDADIIWNIVACPKIELRDESQTVPVPPSVLRNLFLLKQKGRDNKKGTLTLVESKLNELKTSSPHNFNLIMETFEACGSLFLMVSTDSPTNYDLNTHLDNESPPRAVLADTNLNAGMII